MTKPPSASDTATSYSSRPSLHLVPTLAFLSRLPSHAPASRSNGDPFSSLLIPASDLTSLLSDPDLRARYRAGRYVAGKNVSLGFPAWTVPISSTATSLAQRCDPHSSRSIIAALSLHIGIRAIASWDETAHLREVQENFVHEVPTLASDTIHGVQRVLETLQPASMSGGREAMLVVSEQVDDELKGLVGSTGMTARCLIPYAMMVTLGEQPKKYMNGVFREEMVRKVEGLRKWLSLRAETVERVIATFESGGGEI